MRVLFAVGLLLLANAAAQTSAANKMPEKSSAALEGKVRAVWEGFKNKDKAAVAALLADDFRTLSSGDSKFGDKNSEIAEVDDFTLDQYTLTDFHRQPLGPNAALITYTAEFSGKSSGQPVHTRGIFGEVWTRQGTAWKCVYSQETDLH